MMGSILLLLIIKRAVWGHLLLEEHSAESCICIISFNPHNFLTMQMLLFIILPLQNGENET